MCFNSSIFVFCYLTWSCYFVYDIQSLTRDGDPCHCRKCHSSEYTRSSDNTCVPCHPSSCEDSMKRHTVSRCQPDANVVCGSCLSGLVLTINIMSCRWRYILMQLAMGVELNALQSYVSLRHKMDKKRWLLSGKI